jgi:hypothetical protein
MIALTLLSLIVKILAFSIQIALLASLILIATNGPVLYAT